MPDKLSKGQRSYNMSRIRGKNTSPERALKKYLKKKGYKISSVKLFGSPDIVLKRKKIAIFVDGCFWHKCRKHYIQPKTKKLFWIKKINQNVKRDKIVNQTLGKNGWKIIRIWEHEIKNSKSQMVNRKLNRCFSSL